MSQSDEQVFAELLYYCTPMQRNLLSFIVQEFVDTGIVNDASDEKTLSKFFCLCSSSQRSSILAIAQEFVDTNIRNSSSFPYIILFQFHHLSKKKLEEYTEKVSHRLTDESIKGFSLSLNETSVALFIETCDVHTQKVAIDIMRKIGAFAVVVMSVVTKEIVFQKRLSSDSLGMLHLD